MLTPEQFEKWIAKLRSGEVEQGKGCLAPTPDTRCCLGVARDLFGLREIGCFCSSPFPETDLPNWFQDILSKKNDCSNIGFPGIADFIEKTAKAKGWME